MSLEESNDNDVKKISRDNSITYLDLYFDIIYNSQLKRISISS